MVVVEEGRLVSMTVAVMIDREHGIRVKVGDIAGELPLNEGTDVSTIRDSIKNEKIERRVHCSSEISLTDTHCACEVGGSDVEEPRTFLSPSQLKYERTSTKQPRHTRLRCGV